MFPDADAHNRTRQLVAFAADDPRRPRRSVVREGALVPKQELKLRRGRIGIVILDLSVEEHEVHVFGEHRTRNDALTTKAQPP